MIITRRRRSRQKLGVCERFEQPFRVDSDSPRLFIDTRAVPDRCVDVAWSPGDRMIAAGTTGAVKLWTLNPAPALRTLPTGSERVIVLAFDLDGRLLAAGSAEGTLRVWDVPSRRLVWSNEAHAKGIAALEFGSRGALMSVGKDGAVKLWGAGSGRLQRSVPVPDQVVDGCAISPNLKRVALGGERAITFVDTDTGRLRRREIAGDGDTWIGAAAFADTSKILAAGGSDGIVGLWSVAAGRQLRQVGRPLVRAKSSRSLRPAGSSAPARQDPFATGPDPIMSLAFGSGDSLLAGGTLGGRVTVWDVKSGRTVASVAGHTADVLGMSFSRSGRLLATCGGFDRIVKIWRVRRSLEEAATILVLGDDDWAATTPDERFDGSPGGLAHAHWVAGRSYPVPVGLVPLTPPDATVVTTLDAARTRKVRARATPRTLPDLRRPAVGEEAVEPCTPVLTVRTSPSHRVFSVAWSPDGSLLVSGGEDGNVDVWERSTGNELRTLHGHDGRVTALAFVGGDMLASGAKDGTVRLWNIRTGRLIHIFTIGLRNTGIAIASAAGGYLLCAAYDGTVRWLHVDTLTRVHTERVLLENNGRTSLLNEIVAVSPDGRIVARPYHRDSVAVFDLPAQRLLYEFPSNDTPAAIRFDSTGQRFLVGGATSRTIIVLGGSGEGKAEHDPSTFAVDEWATTDLRRTASHLGHGGNVVAIDFDPCGAGFATGAMDGTARIWPNDDRGASRMIKTGSDTVSAVAYNADGSLLATGEGSGNFIGRISVWSSATGTHLQTFERHIGDVHPVRFSADGTLLAAAGEDGILRVWRLTVRTPPMLVKGHTDRIFSLAFSPDGGYIATASWDGTSRLWQSETGELVWMLDSRAGVKVWSVAFSPLGDTLATGCDDGRVTIFWTHSGEILRSLEASVPGQTRMAYALAYAPDGRQIATGAADGRIVLWDIVTGEARKVLQTASPVFSLDFNSDGSLLASGDLGQNVCVYDSGTGEIRHHLKGHATPRHVEKGTTVRFTPDGERLVTGGTDGTIRIWDAATGRPLSTVQGHAGPIACVEVNRTSTLLAAGSNDASASLWDLRGAEAPAKICSLYSFPDGSWAVIDARGRFDAANGGDIPWLHWVIGLESVALSQLKERYFEPYLLPKLMGAEAEPLREVPSLTTVALHPEVELVSIERHGGVARVRVTNRGGGIGRVVVTINGKEADADARGERHDPHAPVQEIVLDVSRHPFLKSGKNRCEVRTYNADGYLTGRQLQWECTAPSAPEETPDFWAIVVGISDYQGDDLDLRFAAKDAEDVAAAARIGAAHLFGADRVSVQLLTSPPRRPEASGDGAGSSPKSPAIELTRPTRQNIERAFERATAARSTDVLLVYLAGHGVNHGGQDGDYYYLTADARTGNLADPAVRHQTAISSVELTEWIRKVPALKQAVILDTCAAGRFVDKLSETRTIPASQTRALERLKDRTGTYVLAGSTADAVSYESSRFGQGLLTYSVLFGMRGAALREGEFVDVSKLFEHAADFVPQLASGLGGIQRPLIASPKGGSSFDIGSLDPAERKRIPLATERPLILAVALEEEEAWKDTLDAGRMVNALLRERAADADAPFIFVDARDHPDAYHARGRYTIAADLVTVKVRLFHNADMVGGFEHVADRSAVEDVCRELTARTVDEVLTHFGAGPVSV